MFIFTLMTWSNRYKAMKKHFGWTNQNVADISGNTKESVNTVTQPSQEMPRWLRFAIVVFEKMK